MPPKLIAEGGNTLAKRNMALYGDKLFIASSDAHLVALDAKTGKVVWDHTVADWTKGWRYSSGPFIAGGKVIAGHERLQRSAGRRLLHHRPRSEHRRGAVARSHACAERRPERRKSWNGLPHEQRFGGSAWIAGSYDPEQNTVYYGVGQPYPWIADMRGTLVKKEGFDNSALYTDSTLAIDPSTGKLKWYHQHLPNDTDDLDYSYERVLVDIPVNGETRKALVTAGKIAHHRGDRPHERSVPVGEGDGAAEIVAIDRSEDRRKDPQSGRHSAYRQDDGELSRRSGRARLAGNGL